MGESKEKGSGADISNSHHGGKGIPTISITEDSIKKWIKVPPEIKLRFLEELARIKYEMRKNEIQKGKINEK